MKEFHRVLKCGCSADKSGNKQSAIFQNQIYGQGMRVFTRNKDGEAGYCTVCGKKHERKVEKRKA